MKKYIPFIISTVLLFSACTDLFDFGNNDQEDPEDSFCTESLVDERDNQNYEVIKIGNQCWMAENLNYGTFVQSNFQNAEHSDVSNNGVVEKYALDNEPSNNILYGGIYDWKEMMNYNFTEGSQGICPAGWHVPSDAEWQELEESTGGTLNAGKALTIGGSSGFNILMAGSRTAKGGFAGSLETSFWTSSPSASHPDSRASNRKLVAGADNIQRNTDVMVTGKYCRCIKDK